MSTIHADRRVEVRCTYWFSLCSRNKPGNERDLWLRGSEGLSLNAAIDVLRKRASALCPAADEAQNGASDAQVGRAFRRH